MYSEKSERKQKALICFLGNIDYDTRCYNLYKSLTAEGLESRFIGFDWLTDGFTTKKGSKTVYRLSKKSSFLFYLKFNILLFISSLKKDFNICFAEDIYTLPVMYLVSRIKRAKIIYDSRELYGFLAGLKKKKFVQWLVSLIEKTLIKHVDLVLVTGLKDKEILSDLYKISNILVLRNLPLLKKDFLKIDLRNKFNIPSDKLILVYQGVILDGRGLKILFDTLKDLNNFSLIILGGGEKINYYKKLSEDENLTGKVYFAGKIIQEELLNYTASCDIGISIIEDISLSYHYALPNKLFEYIMAGIPVIVSKLPQMVKIINEFNTGWIVDLNVTGSLTQLLREIDLNRAYIDKLRQNCSTAREILCWENEFTNIKTSLLGF